MRDAVRKLWPEIEWIDDQKLREKVLETWVRAFEESPLTPADLDEIPFTLLVPDCPVTFMQHKRCVVHVARRSAESMREFFGTALPIDMDTVIAGAILADVGKLLEYEKVGGRARQSKRGEALRHPFTGVALAMACGVPVACANTSSLAEIASGSAFLFDPHTPQAIAEALLALLADPNLQNDLRQRGLQRASEFSWKQTAEETLRVYRSQANF